MLKCWVNSVRFGLFSSFCSLDHINTSGRCWWGGGRVSDRRVSVKNKYLQDKGRNSLYLNLVEQLRVHQSQLFSEILTPKVQQSFWSEENINIYILNILMQVNVALQPKVVKLLKTTAALPEPFCLDIFKHLSCGGS